MVSGELRTLLDLLRAARFPGDDLVETTLAEAELDAHHPEAAEAAADRASKADPGDTDPIILKGRAIAEGAEKAKGDSRHLLFDQARKLFIAANKIDAEDPEPLMEFYSPSRTKGFDRRRTRSPRSTMHQISRPRTQACG